MTVNVLEVLKVHGGLEDAAEVVADLINGIHNLGLLYEAGCDIDTALAELENLAAAAGGMA